ncbi:MAG: aldehyde dehydrogenase family protein [Desulfobacterales bacterium]|jgi:aldehyde dehydrogenase (NAD+)|nr:aldehyde dehydrogenase family protein [Desulfobacterales bacterium]
MDSAFAALDLLGEQQGAGFGSPFTCRGEVLNAVSPIDLEVIGRIRTAAVADYETVLRAAAAAFKRWSEVPAPQRGEIVRRIGGVLRDRKKELAEVVAREVGKIRSEAEGEVQEMIDMADFAVGQSRMLYGSTMPSERPRHRLYEQWLPLGPVGVITAFNFPLAVWAWNALLALVCGNTVVWKPSAKAALSAVAAMKLIWPVLAQSGAPEGVLALVIGGRGSVGQRLIDDPRLPLISATGSVEMGRHVSQAVSARLGRTILELGGNNAVIVAPSADLDLALRAVVFGAVGTAGQRCTTTRRAIVHRDIYERFCSRLTGAYRKLRIGNPLAEGTHMGPLIDRAAVEAMQAALEKARGQGGRVLYGGDVLAGGLFAAGTYVTPCLVEADADLPIVQEETFAPILYLTRYDWLEEAIGLQNAVPQGLSSAIFTRDLLEAELFLSHRGSDCGIANVNLGTSGAEIGAAFGGEKQTGGGREAGSDAWKAYMRRQACTINWSRDLPLSQGVDFSIE